MRCESCGNDYDKPLIIEYRGQEHVYDCFECAIAGLAPVCTNCGIRVIGHGTESNNEIFCSAHCAEQKGYPEMVARL